jgi:four helix bundle protein
MAFLFENLKVYQDALSWVERADRLTKGEAVQSQKSFIDQLRRAALSIPLNIAEGNGRWHKAEKRQFFWIARGSVFECVALIQILHRSQLVNEEEYRGCYAILEELTKMLTGLIKSVENLREERKVTQASTEA